MAVYAITGKLGSGKGKAGIDQIRRYLSSGRRVATNCDVFLEHLMPSTSRAVVTRIPDKPSHVDLYMIGSGNKFVQFDPILSFDSAGFSAIPPSPALLAGFDESHNGALVLDECGSWLNTRDFQDKGRKHLLEWAIHARKYGWDIYFIMQNISQVDKQLRDSLLEYVVRLNRLDRMKVPFISSGIKLMTAGAFDGSMPRLHIGVVRLGASPDALVADRWVFRGDDLNAAYNTTQVFSDSYPNSIHSLLSAWHLSANVGLPVDFIGPVRLSHADEVLLSPRTLPRKPFHKHMTKFLFLSLILGVVIGIFGGTIFSHNSKMPSVVVADSVPVFSENVHAVGVIRIGPKIEYVMLSDGTTVRPIVLKISGNSYEAQVSEKMWVRGIL